MTERLKSAFGLAQELRERLANSGDSGVKFGPIGYGSALRTAQSDEASKHWGDIVAEEQQKLKPGQSPQQQRRAAIAEGYVNVAGVSIHHAPALTEDGGAHIGGVRSATVGEVRDFFKRQGTKPPVPVRPVSREK